MRDKQPLMHLLSRYVIRPCAFDRDPYSIPKAASMNKYYNNYNNTKGAPLHQKHSKAEETADDFETVEAPKKKEKKSKPFEGEQAEEIEPTVEPKKEAEAPK